MFLNAAFVTSCSGAECRPLIGWVAACSVLDIKSACAAWAETQFFSILNTSDSARSDTMNSSTRSHVTHRAEFGYCTRLCGGRRGAEQNRHDIVVLMFQIVSKQSRKAGIVAATAGGTRKYGGIRSLCGFRIKRSASKAAEVTLRQTEWFLTVTCLLACFSC